MKITRDPVTGYAVVEICNQHLVLQKDTTAQEVLNGPIKEVIECQL